MDKVLAAIIESKTCSDLFKSLERFMQETDLSSLIISRKGLNDIFNTMFQDSPRNVETDYDDKFSLPNYVYVALAILSMVLGDTYIHRYALRFSRIFNTKVLKALDDESLARFCQRVGIRLEFSGNKCFREVQSGITKNDSILTICYRYRLPIIDYLHTARKLLTEQPWKLSSLALARGYIYVDNREKVLRLISERIYNIISTRLRELRGGCEDKDVIWTKLLNLLREFDLEFAEAIDKFASELQQTKPAFKSSQATIPISSSSKVYKEVLKINTVEELIDIAQRVFPPCIRELVNALTRGENLSHHQRFAVATFLINLGIDIELILRLFSYSPDFNEKIARYQIEHLAGLRGSRKKYLVYSCNTMKTLGICRSECGIKNPLLYLRKVSSIAKIEQKDG